MKLEIIDCEKYSDKYLVHIKDDPYYIDGKGGQLGDRGTIGGNKILEVTPEGPVISVDMAPGLYDCEIDEKRQKYIAEQHSAEHILSGIAFYKYGLNNVGFRMGEDYTTVDLDSQDITEEMINNIENEVNDVIMKGIERKISVLDHEKAMEITNIRKPISPKVKGDVRIVEFPGCDICACAGFHVKNTKDLRMFKIIQHENIKGKFTRFYFIAGEKAFSDYQTKHKIIRDLCHMFSSKENELLKKITAFNEEKKSMENEIKNLSQFLAKNLAKELQENPVVINDTKILYYFGNKNINNFLTKTVDLDNYLLISGADGVFQIASNKYNCKDLVAHILSLNKDLKGGGSNTKCNFKGSIDKNMLIEQINNYYENK